VVFVCIEAKYDGGGGDNWITGAIVGQSSSQIITNKPTSSVKALKGKYHIPWTFLLQAHLGVFQLCLWPLIAPGNLGRVAMPLISPLMPVPQDFSIASTEKITKPFQALNGLKCSTVRNLGS